MTRDHTPQTGATWGPIEWLPRVETNDDGTPDTSQVDGNLPAPPRANRRARRDAKRAARKRGR